MRWPAGTDRPLEFLHECLWEAVELVDWRCGEIRTRAINQWLADESLKGIQQLAHPRIHLYLRYWRRQKLAERLEDQLPEMLTFLDGIAQPLADWQAQAEQHFQDHAAAACFRDSVARFGGWSMPCGTMAMRSSAKPLWKLSNGWRSGSKVTHRSKAG